MSNTDPTTEERPGWLASPWGWTLLLVSISVAVVGATVAEQDPREAWVAPICVGLLAAWFGLQVRRSRPLDDGTRGAIFLTFLVVGMGVGAYLSDWMQLLLFVSYPLTWVLSKRGLTGMVWTWILTATVATGLMVANPREWTGILVYSMVVGTFSTAMGLWITNIFTWGTERQQMHRQLVDSQQKLVELTSQAATQQERERLAREIHDTLAQGFVSVVTLSQAIAPTLQSRADGDPELTKALARLELIETVARDNLEESRALIRAWKPPVLNEGDLAMAIERLAGQFYERTGITPDLQIDLPNELDSDTEVAMLRVAQEAFNNIYRHAQATAVTLELRQSDGATIVQITDDGIGRGDSTENTGLTGMRERVALLGGEVRVRDAGNPAGTTLMAIVPRETKDEK